MEVKAISRNLRISVRKARPLARRVQGLRLSDALAVADFSPLKAGRFLKVDSPRNIVDGFDRRLVAVRSDDMFRLLQDLRSMEDVDRCYTFGDTHHIVLKEGSTCTPEDISGILSGKYGHTGVEAAEQAATLEDCYMNLDG